MTTETVPNPIDTSLKIIAKCKNKKCEANVSYQVSDVKRVVTGSYTLEEDNRVWMNKIKCSNCSSYITVG